MHSAHTKDHCEQLEEPKILETRLGPVGCRSSGQGPILIFFAGALANHDLWRDVVANLEDRYRCITIDLPLGAHSCPLSPTADRSASSLARLLLDCLELLEVEHATMVANDTAGGLLLLSLATDHPALRRVDRLVLTNCESYEKFPPDPLRKASALCQRFPQVARLLIRLQARSSSARRRAVARVTASGLDHEREESFFGPVRRDARAAADLVAAMAGFRPQLLIDAAIAIPRFGRPVLLVWGDSCEFFPIEDAKRLASEFPDATLVPVPGARTWVPIDNPSAVSDAVVGFVPLQGPVTRRPEGDRDKALGRHERPGNRALRANRGGA
jgi:pimeloyl-ACP methyl ester carboxylesterase